MLRCLFACIPPTILHPHLFHPRPTPASSHSPAPIVPPLILISTTCLNPKPKTHRAFPHLDLHHMPTRSSPRASPPLAPCLPSAPCLHATPFTSALGIMVRRRPQQLSPCTCSIGDDGRRCLLRRKRRNKTSGEYAHRCLIPHKRGTGSFVGRAHKWIRRRSCCICFFGGLAHRWRRRRSFGIGFVGGRAQRCPPPCILGTGALHGLAHRWIRRRNSCMSFFLGCADRCRRLHISYILLLRRSCSHMLDPPHSRHRLF
jgi:hypothetical protein